MKVELTKEDKIQIAQILRVHRRRCGLTQNEYIKDEQGIVICSLSTYSRLENGDIIKNDEIYEALIWYQLKLRFDYRSDLRDSMRKEWRSVYQSVEAYDVVNLEKQILELTTLLHLQRRFLFSTCYHQVLLMIRRFYIEHQMVSMEVMQDCLLLIPLWDDYIKAVMKDMLFKSMVQLGSNMHIINDWANHLFISQAKDPLNYMNRILLHYYNDEMLTALLRLRSIYRYFKSKHLYNRILDTYDIMLAVYVNSQIKEIPDLNHQYLAFLKRNESRLDPLKQRQSQYNQAMILLGINHNEEAYQVLMTIARKDDFISLKTLVICEYLQGRYQIPRRSITPIINFGGIKDTVIYSLYQFYQMKANGMGALELEQFILNHVLTAIDLDDEIIMNLVKEEIIQLCKQRRHTALLRRYQRLKEHSLVKENL